MDENQVPGITLMVFCALITEKLLSEWIGKSGADRAILESYGQFVTWCKKKTV